MKIQNDGISRGHNTKILQFKSDNNQNKKSQMHLMGCPSSLIKKKLSEYFVFSQSTSLHHPKQISNLPDKRQFMDDIGKIMINQKLSSLFPEITSSPKTNRIKSPKDNKVTIMGLNPSLINNTEEMVDYGIIYKEPALEDYYYNKQNKFNYIESLSQDTNMRGGEAKILKGKFKNLKKKLIKVSREIGVGDNNGTNSGIYASNGYIPTDFERKKSRDEVTNLNLYFRQNSGESTEGNISKDKINLNTKFKNPLLRSCLEDCLSEQRENVILPVIDNRNRISDKVRLRHLIAKPSKLNKIMSKNHFTGKMTM